MYINLCPNTIGITDISFTDMVNLAVKYGFGGIDFSPNYFDSKEQAKAAGELLESLQLKWGLFYLPCDFLNVDELSFEKGMECLKNILPLVQAAGCRRTYNHIWPGSNFLQYKENFKWHVERLKILEDVLSEYNVHLGIEFIGAKTLRDSFQHPFIYKLQQALELADAVSLKIGIVIDSFHWYTSGGTLEDLKAIASSDRIVNVHMNDAVATRSREQQLDGEREMPLASGLVDAFGLLKFLKKINYQGPVICEPFQPNLNRLKSKPIDDVALEVSVCMKELLKKVND